MANKTRADLTTQLSTGGSSDNGVESRTVKDLLDSIPISATVLSIVTITQTAYDALPSPDANTLYVIVG